MTSWEEYKAKAWERINRDKEIGYLDPDIYDILKAFFSRQKSYTQSSCSGRISIIDAKLPWERRDSTVVFKDHLKFSVEDLYDVLDKGIVRRLWLIVQGPIIHVYTKDMEEALNVLKLARDVGFKHSGILSFNDKGILVELRTGVKMVHLLKPNLPEEEAKHLVEVSLEILNKGKEKLNNLRNIVELSVANDSMKLGEDSKLDTKFHYRIS
ncbi:tRNA-wybutosine modification methyltransferase TYW3 [Sulfolobus acidocaldarius]|uniref:tRNA(Phe) 7-((3-amino-3-carboxypropyl)-4-demethylwyosine(37)-N(4))-methyltransferase n=4 Tax=Sulfolobus acidocaldarius TaxID=2285 RepID=Q4J8G5_SULAC|nr:hypothetical protein [Sulfolobus acidocaldarius]AAY80916.1 conserved Archaeal protein [Sulfolobus acidocaldarius DSM 639]AGE71516.1 hypothetical protein SacN8_07780 [Sulfolobus acidocaldarius N8]AGE73789.1 hypothetical protein SacRon12I_07790 [Sulfolobus acidocaldarius Ron12/I]ALU30252.1 hypothetical protein ATY89_10090 [Sulfolobus acidocaldarius]ALU30968.1 hypothetical protein ATZ20_01645 [Sulfolobus acidocaldarius]